MSKKADIRLSEALADYYADPLGYTMFAFPWDKDPALQVVSLAPRYRKRYDCEFGPDEWACEFLDDLGSEVKIRGFDGTRAVDPIQYSTASGHGIGKSTLVAWIIKWIMDTRPYAQGTVTANTAEQLRTKTWAELGKWHKRSVTQHWFDYTSGRGAMALRHKVHKEEWFCSAQTCREENSEAFAGQHAANSTSFYVFDEASNVPNKIFEVREGGTTDGEPMTFDFGNPTRNSGRFFDNTLGKFKHRYKVRMIDSRNVAITNKKRLDEWIEDYGIDSDFVKVRVRGEFPSQGSTQFIPSDLVDGAMDREVVPQLNAARVLGVDVARYGDNDSVIFPRKGCDFRSFEPGVFNGLDTVQLTGKVIETYQFFENLGDRPAMIFVDVGGIGGGVVDQLRHLGYPVTGVGFGNKPVDHNTYRYKADEMWGMLKADLPNVFFPERNSKYGQRIHEELTSREFGYTITGQKINLESKDDMKKRGIPSPDLADALVLTYAQEIAPVHLSAMGPASGLVAIDEYDPYKDVR